MANYELWIKKGDEFFLADMGSDMPAVNIQRNNISDMKTRQSDYTQELRLPMSNNNVKIFEHINIHEVKSGIRHREINCRLYCDGYTLFGEGSIMRIMSVTDTFNVALVGKEKAFMLRLQGLNGKGEQKTLNDLGFTDRIVRGINGIINSNPFGTTASNNIFFAIANFSTDLRGRGSLETVSSSVLNYHIDGQMPFVRLKYIIGKILAENGEYSLDSDILGDVEFENACIPFNSIKPNIFGYYVGDKINVEKPQGYWISDRITMFTPRFRFDMFFQDTSRWTRGTIRMSDYDFNHITYRADAKGDYTFRIVYSVISATSGTLTPEIYTTNGQYYAATQQTGTRFSLSVHINVTLEEMDEIGFLPTLRFVHNTTPTVTNLAMEHISIEITHFIPILDEEVSINKNILLKGNLPNITQYDFFKEFLKIYGLTIDVDDKNREIRAYTFNQIVKNKKNALDWSKKMHLNRGTKKFTIDGYAEKNFLRYKTEENEVDREQTYMQIREAMARHIFDNNIGEVFFSYTETGGKNVMTNFLPGYWYFIIPISFSNLNIEDIGFIKAEDKNLKAQNDMITLLFESAISTRYNSTQNSQSGNGASIQRFQYDTETKTGKFDYDKPPKLLLARGWRSTNLNYYIKGQLISGSHSLRYVSQNTGDNSIEAQALLNKYYNALEKNILSDMRFMENVEFLLTAEDVHNFDPFMPVYIDYFGSYFYVSKIKNFIAGRLTKVDLVKI